MPEPSSYFPAIFNLGAGPVQAIQTAQSDPRVRMDSSGLWSTDASGAKVFNLDAAHGTGFFKGGMSVPTVKGGAGATIQWVDSASGALIAALTTNEASDGSAILAVSVQGNPGAASGHYLLDQAGNSDWDLFASTWTGLSYTGANFEDYTTAYGGSWARGGWRKTSDNAGRGTVQLRGMVTPPPGGGSPIPNGSFSFIGYVRGINCGEEQILTSSCGQQGSATNSFYCRIDAIPSGADTLLKYITGPNPLGVGSGAWISLDDLAFKFGY